MSNTRYITALIHAESKVGKSWLGDTTPPPRLIVDADPASGIRFTPSRKVWWNPMTEQPPEPDGTWETCVVRCKDLPTLNAVHQWLNSGQHPFRSVTLDSVMEVQAIAMNSVGGRVGMHQQSWGELLAIVEQKVRDFRDLVEHPVKPLEAVIYIAGTRLRDGMFRPLLDGQITIKLPYLLDCCGYLYTQRDEAGTNRRALLLEPTGTAVAGNNFGGRLPSVVWDPNIEQMLDTIYGQETQQ